MTTDAREEAERRYPDNQHTGETPFYATMKRHAFESGSEWQASQPHPDTARAEAAEAERDQLREILSRDHAPDPHDADWWRRSAAFWAGEAEKHEAERDAHVEQTRNWMREIDKLIAERDALAARIAEALAQRLDHGAQGNGYAQLVDRMRRILKGES